MLGEFGDEMFREPEFMDTDYKDYLMGDDSIQRRKDDAEDNDPQYNIFLNGLKQDGNLWVVPADERNGLPECYIMEDVSDDGLDQDIRSERWNMIGESIEDVLSNSSTSMVFGSFSENQRKTMFEDGVKFDSLDHPYLFEDEKCLDEVLDTAIICASDMQGGSAKKSNSEHARTPEKVTKGGQSKAAHIDDDYLLYLQNYVYDKDRLMVTEGDSDLYVHMVHMDNGTCSMKRNPKSLALIGRSHVDKDDSCDCLGSPSGESHSPFREQVMRILRNPFDKKELERLAAVMKATKPMERNLDLRFGREQSYATNKDGKSYLDRHPDLKRKLEAAPDCRQELNLLRGFFFWLQNLPQQGAFKPWQDEVCLALRPGDN